jgi:BirA family transcriptional regulator, biotin operon repressor / biotin---[acetyl-CoA-carboxylase] ligase
MPSLPSEMLDLDTQEVLHAMGQFSDFLGRLDILPCVDSTNNYLIARRTFPKSYAVLAQQQTAGRGQFNRHWFSPADNLYLSLLWHFKVGIQSLNQLYLRVGKAVIAGLEAAKIQGVYLKAPNDIFYNNKKLGGILIEIFSAAADSCQGIIGIGLNLKLPSDAPIDQAWIDLHTICSRQINRNQLAGYLLKNLLKDFI